MSKDENQSIGCLTISELKALIKECLREHEEEKHRATYAGQEEMYKQLWIRPPTTTDGFKCGG